MMVSLQRSGYAQRVAYTSAVAESHALPTVSHPWGDGVEGSNEVGRQKSTRSSPDDQFTPNLHVLTTNNTHITHTK